jgi:hypothetical protein
MHVICEQYGGWWSGAQLGRWHSGATIIWEWHGLWGVDGVNYNSGSIGRAYNLFGPWWRTSSRAVLNLMDLSGHLPHPHLFLPIKPCELGRRRPHCGAS